MMRLLGGGRFYEEGKNVGLAGKWTRASLPLIMLCVLALIAVSGWLWGLI
jgi:hypothetical protein